jgi:hypothetical protein
MAGPASRKLERQRSGRSHSYDTLSGDGTRRRRLVMVGGVGVVVGVALLLPWRKGSMPKLTPSQSNISVNIEGANALVKSRVVPIVEKVVPFLRSLFARVAPALTHQAKSD